MRCLAVCQDELVIRILDEILLPGFEVEFIVESRSVSRRLHEAGIHVVAGDPRHLDTYQKADLSPSTCVIIEDNGRRSPRKILEAVRDAGGTLVYILGIGAVYFVGFIYFAFFVNFHDKKLNIRSRLLYAPDVASNLPAKGFILAAASIGFATFLLVFNLDTKFLDFIGLTTFLNNVAMQTRALIIVSVILTTCTVFISEFMSSTATAVAFFTVAVALCKSLNVPALPILIGISAVATVPSMSPIASPVNAMAFGGIKGVSLRRMITVGFVMDLAAIVVVNLWSLIYIPWYYRIRL